MVTFFGMVYGPFQGVISSFVKEMSDKVQERVMIPKISNMAGGQLEVAPGQASRWIFYFISSCGYVQSIGTRGRSRLISIVKDTSSIE